MYINKLEIIRHKILEDVVVNFNIPNDNKNIVNLVVGINGCGKTSILELIIEAFQGQLTPDSRDSKFKIIFNDNEFIESDDNTPTPKLLNENNQPIGRTSQLSSKYLSLSNEEPDSGITPKLVYLPAHLNFQYAQQINTPSVYQFINKVNSQTLLGFAESYIRDFILNQERKSNKSNPKERKEEAISKFNSFFKDTEFVTKLYDLNDKLKPIFQTINGNIVTIDKLSSGEKQLYARVISIMLLEPNNSIILIDEPEISLHPRWQQTILKVYQNIGTSNQFIIATHSAQIIASAKYKDLIILYRDKNKIKVLQEDKKTFVQSDVNNILEEVMGARAIPYELKELHKQYRKLVEDAKEDSNDAKIIRDQILECESIGSEFMQSMDFLVSLRGS